ncbi:MAG: hypothetical protein NZZ41_01665 [Candidatus Dojkabacteria bacterium]|nr:hypothetical protein [Candidatus Dojkabacteria bacterium]
MIIKKFINGRVVEESNNFSNETNLSKELLKKNKENLNTNIQNNLTENKNSNTQIHNSFYKHSHTINNTTKSGGCGCGR